jgi:proline iminopeptidase
LLISDIETIRAMLNIDQWLVFGGSWGSTLALAYGEAHPEVCLGFVLRGIFLITKAEVEWFIHGMNWFYPEVFADFAATIPKEERHNLLEAYGKRLFSVDPSVYLPAAKSWSRYESSCLYLEPQPGAVEEFEKVEVSLGLGRLEAHYMMHAGFMEEDQLIKNIDKISHLPAVIVQGRYDVICPPNSAFRLNQAWPGAVLKVISNAGHAAMEPGIATALVTATEQFKQKRKFG